MKKIIKNYFYTSAYQIFILILPIITLPYVSRVLLPVGIGINSWVSAINSYFVMFAVLGLTTYGQREIALCRDKPDKLKKTFWELEVASLVTTALALIVYFIFILVVKQHLSLLLIYSCSIVACIFDISWLFSGIENFKVLVVRNFIIKVCSVILILVFVRNQNDLWIYVLIQSMSVLVSNISLWPIAKSIVGHPTFKNWKIIFTRVKYSLRFFVPQASIGVYVTLNKILLGFISTKTQTGYFDSSDKLLRMMFSLFLATSTVILPRMSNLYAHKNFSKIRKFINGMLKISMWAIALVIFLVFSNSKLIIKIAFGAHYVQMIPVLRVAVFMLVPMALSNVLANQYLVPSNRIGSYTRSVVYGAIFNFFIEIPLIIVGQAVGAAIASVLSELVVTFIQVSYCRKEISFYKDFTSSILVVLLGSLMIIFGIFVILIIQNIFLIFIISLVVGLMYLLITYRWLVKTFTSMA